MRRTKSEKEAGRTGEGRDDDKSRDTERVEGKDGGEGCNSLLSPSPAPSPNLPRTINQIRRQTLIEDYHATGSSTHTHTLRETEDLHATGSIRTHTFMLTTQKKFAAHTVSAAFALTSTN